ncbi:hypothetical protein AGMMS49949_09250 [Alphaproteobacteria bacterium]|nr:hypothetical protein AGMMS49949_09250 [Alphaproteobacteria bacterium]
MKSQQKGSIVQRSLTFLAEVRKEVAQVVWPKRKETSMTAVVVCIFAFIMAFYLLIVDQSLIFILQGIMK